MRVIVIRLIRLIVKWRFFAFWLEFYFSLYHRQTTLRIPVRVLLYTYIEFGYRFVACYNLSDDVSYKHPGILVFELSFFSPVFRVIIENEYCLYTCSSFLRASILVFLLRRKLFIYIINNSFRCAQRMFYFIFIFSQNLSVSIIIARRLHGYFFYLRPFYRNVYVHISSVAQSLHVVFKMYYTIYTDFSRDLFHFPVPV